MLNLDFETSVRLLHAVVQAPEHFTVTPREVALEVMNFSEWENFSSMKWEFDGDLRLVTREWVEQVAGPKNHITWVPDPYPSHSWKKDGPHHCGDGIVQTYHSCVRCGYRYTEEWVNGVLSVKKPAPSCNRD